VGDQVLEVELEPFVPARDKNYSRIDRSAEAIGQTWQRVLVGELELPEGPCQMTIQASDRDVEVLNVVLFKE
jgi:hypothetical protein